ncbi:MAG: hypothetical protein AAGH65_04985 [Pseudomonadota bacterium]
MNPIVLITLARWLLLVTSVFLVACDTGSSQHIALDADHQTAAELTLYPQFDLAHAAPLTLAPELNQLLNDTLDEVAAVQWPRLDPHPFSLVITAEPDADAGCIAGGRLFVSKGMLAWIEHGDELAGVLASAMRHCAEASQRWRERDDQVLVELDERSELHNRYIDYRLQANASLFNQAVISGCGSDDCHSDLIPVLDAVGVEADGVLRLTAIIQQAWPDSAWLERSGLPVTEPPDQRPTDPAFQRLLSEHYSNRTGYEYFADVRRQIGRGQLILAYRASLGAMRELGKTYEVHLLQAELDLHNRHPLYSEDIFEEIEERFGPINHREFYWGWMYAQTRRHEQAFEMLNRSLEILPKVSAHHYLGQLYIVEREFDLAELHLGRVIDAGPTHYYRANAELYLDVVDRRRP